MKKLAFIALAVAAVLMTGCSTFRPPSYTVPSDNTVALKKIGVGNINVGNFQGPAEFDEACRGAGPMAAPEGTTFEGYLQQALAEELKSAKMYNAKRPKVTLTGKIKTLEFSSSRGLTGGSWKIALFLSSSNGRSMTVEEYNEFDSGFMAITACINTANAFMPTVQNLMGKVVRSPSFKQLLR